MKEDQEIVAMDGTRAVIKQKGNHLYCLTITSRGTGHNRWGTWEQIQEDVEFFKVAGRLPVSGPRW